MAQNSYIPVGRTSLIKRNGLDYQVQTEYAPRPKPRITTTISSNGRVLHKVDRPLEHPIGNVDEQRVAERTIQRQHDDVNSIIQNGWYKPPPNPTQDAAPERSREPAKHSQEAIDSVKPFTVYDQLLELEGVERVYRVTTDGEFIGAASSEQFKTAYKALFKNLRDIMNLFLELPGSDGLRETGVAEIEPGRIYFASVGDECFFIVISSGAKDADYEKKIKDIVDPNEFDL
jgi:hypothetical protein